MSKPIFVVAMLFCVSGFSQGKTKSDFNKLLFISQKDSLPYRLLEPDIAGSGKKYPLIVFLHGAGERGRDNEVQIKHISRLFLNRKSREEFPCYVLAPQCPAGAVWASHTRNGSRIVMRSDPTRPMAMLIELIGQIERAYPVDTSRIYVAGLSMGGFGTWDLIARYPDRFAAAVPICGGGDPATAASIRDIPVWAFHGALDKVVPPEFSRTMVKALRDAGAAPGYTEYPDTGHDSWVPALRDPSLLRWIFDQSLLKRPKVK